MKNVKVLPHGSAYPQDITIQEILEKAQYSRLVSTSRLIIALHSIPEDLAYEIAGILERTEQAALFLDLRSIKPSDFEPKTRKEKFFARLTGPQEITWKHYAEKLGLDDKTFWDRYGNMSQKIITHLLETSWFAARNAA